jgi:mono/diheme cytochrome c family protein
MVTAPIAASATRPGQSRSDAARNCRRAPRRGASVVIDGALAGNGMASFRDYVTPDQAESIRAYLSGLAETLRKREAGATPAKK